jgi:hypothetical protein
MLAALAGRRYFGYRNVKGTRGSVIVDSNDVIVVLRKEFFNE